MLDEEWPSCIAGEAFRDDVFCWFWQACCFHQLVLKRPRHIVVLLNLIMMWKRKTLKKAGQQVWMILFDFEFVLMLSGNVLL
ncbi:unnamed protein product [Lactuca virosa]|uniref:Uncharacterized protein n=1 Tax=Lactuca virosa TaxID=75947 RepID=A0AAU9LKF9_9ASTR|nr:unnamed protein product [Lactuca virosa]